MLRDWTYGVGLDVAMQCDSSAARVVAAPQGLGRTHPLDVRFLWLQQAVQEEQLRVLPVPTSENWSGTFTKALIHVSLERGHTCMSFEISAVGSSRHRQLAGGR
jgi:hypothetical protein